MWGNPSKSSTKFRTGGFTLQELLVSMAILLVLVAVTLTGIRDYARMQQHTRLVEEVGHQINLARQQTLASKDDTVYGVYVGPDTVEVFAGATPVAGAAENTILDLSAVSQVVTSNFSDGNSYVVFERLTGAASTAGTITIADNEIVRTTIYTIHSSGLIE